MTMAQHMKPVIVNGVIDETRRSPWEKQKNNNRSPKRKLPVKVNTNSSEQKKKAAILNHINQNSPLEMKQGNFSMKSPRGDISYNQVQQPRIIQAQDYAKVNAQKVTYPVKNRVEKRQQGNNNKRNNPGKQSLSVPKQGQLDNVNSEASNQSVHDLNVNKNNLLNENQVPESNEPESEEFSEENLSIYTDDEEYDSDDDTVSPRIKKKILKKSNDKINHVKEIIRDDSQLQANKDKGVTINLYMAPDSYRNPQTVTVPVSLDKNVNHVTLGNASNVNPNTSPAADHVFRMTESSYTRQTKSHSPHELYSGQRDTNINNNVMSPRRDEKLVPSSQDLYGHQTQIDPAISNKDMLPVKHQHSNYQPQDLYGHQMDTTYEDTRISPIRHQRSNHLASLQTSASNLSTYMRYVPKDELENTNNHNHYRRTPDHLKDLSAKHYLLKKDHHHKKQPDSQCHAFEYSTPALPFIHSHKQSERLQSADSRSSLHTVSSSGKVQYLLRNKSNLKHVSVSTINSNNNLAKKTGHYGSLPLLVEKKSSTKLVRESEVQTDFDYKEDEDDSGPKEIAIQTGNNGDEKSDDKVLPVNSESQQKPNLERSKTISTSTTELDTESQQKPSLERSKTISTSTTELDTESQQKPSLERSKSISTSTTELDKLDNVIKNSVETSTADLEEKTLHKTVTFVKNKTTSTDTDDLNELNLNSRRSKRKKQPQKNMHREFKTMISEELEWEKMYKNGSADINIKEDTGSGAGLSSDDEDIYMDNGNDELTYVMYLQTEQGALIGPLMLEFDDIQIGLPSGQSKKNEAGSNNGYFPTSASIDGSPRGLRNRATGSNSVNEHSSRSHSMLTLHLDSDQQDPEDENLYITKHGKLTFVDLAGSEKTKSDQVSNPGHLVESNNINRSLLVLGNCISSLSDPKRRQGHIPYRDSKLTKLLADSLGGNGVTLMIACVSPSSYNGAESMNTLRYANRAKKIKTKPIITMDPREKLILSLKREIKILRQENHYLRQQLEFPVKPKGQLQRENDEKFLKMLKHYKMESKTSADHHGLYEMLQEYMIENETLRNENSSLYESRDRGRREQQVLARENERLVRRIEGLSREQMMQGTPMSIYSVSSRKSSASDGRQYYDSAELPAQHRQNPQMGTPRGGYGQPKRPPHRLSEPLNKNNPAYFDQQTPRNNIPSNHISQHQPAPALHHQNPHYDYQMPPNHPVTGSQSPRKPRINNPPPHQPHTSGTKKSKVPVHAGGSPSQSRKQSLQQYTPADGQVRQHSNSTAGGESVDEMNERLRQELLDLEGQIRNQSQNNTPQAGAHHRYEVR